MTTEDLIEKLTDIAYKAYKKTGRNTDIGHKFDRHELMFIPELNMSFTCWKEYTVYQMCIYLAEKIPDAKINCNLSGNDSYIGLEIDDKQQKRINQQINTLLHEIELDKTINKVIREKIN